MRNLYISASFKKALRVVFCSFLLFCCKSTEAQTPQYSYNSTLSSNYYPLASANNPFSNTVNKCQWLYLSSDFSPAPVANSYITEVYVLPANTATPTYTDLTVKLKNTALTTLTNGPWNTGLTTCYFAASTTLTATNGNWLKITLQTPFLYTGGNILFEIYNQSYSGGVGIILNYGSLPSDRRQVGNVDSTNPSAVDGATASFGFSISPITTSLSAVNFCAGNGVNVNFNNLVTPAAGNIYTAQLSDANGSFATPVNIGTLSSTATTGTIAATLPAGTPFGTKYRIRVTSSNLAVTGTDNGSNITIGGNRIYVNGAVATTGTGGSWASPLKTVTEALNSANNSFCTPFEIWVAAGTYLPMSDATTVAASRDSSFRILRNGIKLYGGFAGTETALSQRNPATNVTTLSGDIGVANDSTDNSYHVVTILPPANTTFDNSTVISGFTVERGNANATFLQINFAYNGVLIYNAAGGGVLCTGNGVGSVVKALVEGCTIRRNRADNSGAGVHCGGYNGGQSSPTVRNCLITLNDCVEVAGLYAFSRGANGVSNPTVENCRFISNYANTGAGIAVEQRNGSVSNPTVRNCVFAGNTAVNRGAAIMVYHGSVTVSNTVFAGNTADTGSVITIDTGGTATFNNSTLYNPSTTTGAAVEHSGTLNANNTIIWGANVTQVSGSGTSNLSYSDVRGVAAAGTNISANPQFTAPANPIGPDGIWGTSDDGLRLTPCSPAINAGSNTLVPAGIAIDFAGNTRIQNTTVDMGAYEMPYNPTGLPSTTIAMNLANPVCGNTSITFTATTVSPGNVPTYQWYKNGAAVGSNQNTYTANSWSNNDSVWVIHTNNDCNLKDTSNKIFIQVAPVPAAPGTITGPASPCAATSQTYAVAAVANATTYTWAVPAGWTITAGQGTNAITVTITAASGSITVTAGNVCGTSAAQSLAVIPLAIPVTPATPTGPAVLCASSTGNVYSTTAVAGATTYTWTVPTGWTITAGQGTTSVTVTAPAGSSSSGNISVTAGNACGTSTAATLAVSTTVIPATPVAITGPAAPCASTTGNVYSTTAVTGATTYTWAVPAGWVITAGQGTISITVTPSATAGNVTVTADNVCGNSTAQSLSVVPLSIPATPGAISGNSAPCIGATQTYSVAAVTNATSYSWTAPAGWTLSSGGTSTSVTYIVTNATSGQVQVKANGSCGSSANNALNVAPTPVLTPAVTVSTNTPNVCQGTNVAFTATPVNGGTNPTYQWKKNGSNVGGPTDLYNDPLLTSNDVITVVMTSSLPCVTSASVTASNSASVNVTPTAVPGININTAPSVTLCEGTPVTFVTNISGGGTSPVYQWYRNGIAILGQTGPNYTGSGFSDGDTLTVLLTSNAPCRATNTVLSNKVGLIVQQKVVPTLSVSANPGTIVPPGTLVTLTANVTTAAGATPFYQWYQNGVAIGGATGSTYTTQVQSNGDVFSVQVYGLGLCATPSNLRSALLELNTTTVGIGGTGAVVSAESMVLELFPNPNSGRFTVRADWGTSVSAGERVELELVNALGQVVYRQELGMLGGKWRTDIALEDNVANGLYLLRIKQQRAGGSIAKPVMIQR